MIEWFKALHVISVIAWMAGLFYLPRLFVYHADSAIGSVQSETFKVMERRLLRAITTLAMIATWIFGLAMVFHGLVDWGSIWPWVKAILVLAMSGYHGLLARHTKIFARDANDRQAKYFRMINEVPTVLMIGIVIMVVVKPF